MIISQLQFNIINDKFNEGECKMFKGINQANNIFNKIKRKLSNLKKNRKRLKMLIIYKHHYLIH